jgi:hypothetical protein
MTTRQRDIVIHGLLLAIGVVATMIALGLVYRIGHAWAGPPGAVASADDPGGTIASLYDYLRSGKGTAAAGCALMLVVWGARSGLATKWAWFKTPAGGYVLGYGSAAILYIATALASDNPFTLSLLVNALGAGWASSGAWEKLRDIVTAMRAPTPTVPATLAAAPDKA